MKTPLLLLVALLSLAAAPACTPEPVTQYDPALYGTLSVFVDPTWLTVDKANIRTELTALRALGPDFVETDARATAGVIVQPFASPSCFVNAAHWRVGTRVIEIDRTCMTDDDAFMQAVGHEIGHAQGMTHVCEDDDDGADCSPVGRGLAMMGPRLRTTDTGPGFGEAYTGALSQPTPTRLDLLEYQRTHPVRRLGDAGAGDAP